MEDREDQILYFRCGVRYVEWVKHCWPAPGRCPAQNAPGLGVFEQWTPPLTPLLSHVATRDKRPSKERKKSWRNWFGHFIYQVTRPRDPQRWNFAVFNIFLQIDTWLGNQKSCSAAKSIFDGSFNALSIMCPHIWPKINSLTLASREQKL